MEIEIGIEAEYLIRWDSDTSWEGRTRREGLERERKVQRFALA